MNEGGVVRSRSTDARARAEAAYREVFSREHQRSVRGLRDRFSAMLGEFSIPNDAQIEDVELGGVTALRVSTSASRENIFTVWFHSGGYVLGSAHDHRPFGAQLATAAGCQVILVDYRRAPEHAFPAAVEDAVAALDAAIETYGLGHVCVGGDSAGGALTLDALVSRQLRGLPQPRAAVLLSPLLDLTLGSESLFFNAQTDVAVDMEGMKEIAAAYLQGHDARDPRASPLFADLHGLPPTLVLASTTEALRDDARRVAERIGGAGGVASFSEYAEMPHAWPLFASFLPEGQQAFHEMGTFLRAATSDQQ